MCRQDCYATANCHVFIPQLGLFSVGRKLTVRVLSASAVLTARWNRSSFCFLLKKYSVSSMWRKFPNRSSRRESFPDGVGWGQNRFQHHLWWSHSNYMCTRAIQAILLNQSHKKHISYSSNANTFNYTNV